ncbi:MAG: hypothetical protein M1827_001927 [Pycnora praestabilis]|nr:MAG: hypothetical protein M1827_001927 [Pycnora praestabilis]
MVHFTFVAAVSLLSLINNAAAATNYTSQALNTQDTNTIPDNGGPTLYYNGSGPVPPENETSPIPLPLDPLSASQIEDAFFQEILAIVNLNNSFPDNCTKCVASVEVMHLAAITQPASTITDLLIRACNQFKFSIYAATCEQEFSGVGGLGPYWAQLFAKMSLATGDMQAFCFYNYEVCTQPPTIEINESDWFSPKPANKTTAPSPSGTWLPTSRSGTKITKADLGETINVLHLSDWHLDPR